MGMMIGDRYQHAEYSDDAQIVLAVPEGLAERAYELAEQVGKTCECDVLLVIRAADAECRVWTEGEDTEREAEVQQALTDYCGSPAWGEVFQGLS